MTVGTAFLILSAAFFGVGCLFTSSQADYKQQTEHGNAEASDQQALIADELESEL